MPHKINQIRCLRTTAQADESCSTTSREARFRSRHEPGLRKGSRTIRSDSTTNCQTDDPAAQSKEYGGPDFAARRRLAGGRRRDGQPRALDGLVQDEAWTHRSGAAKAQN